MDNGEDEEAVRLDGWIIWEDKGDMAREPGWVHGLYVWDRNREDTARRSIIFVSFFFFVLFRLLRGLTPRALRTAH
jgi:hypothetical protein